ncbi:primosomal protein [Allobranchiibius sp. GilTou38]|uniref:primosomal protein n=1 Tax=Allobranchiibius sp. GilTou38 TaxID=2815210 RepID=UPI001AA0DAF5|nr:primosomal protein [Allobranchiibius sp. GilTou38]MBO1766479.1 primosomal protein [Allobranchiibius sp. GilTou38]
MPIDPRVALQRFTDALEEHLAASRARRGENDPAVVEAYRRVADAFDAYDESLMDAFGEVTPLEVYEGDEDEDDLDDDLDDDDDEASDDREDSELDDSDEDAAEDLDDEDVEFESGPATPGR